MTGAGDDGVERGPNGFPYLDPERCQISQWENGEFHIKMARDDGELFCANMKPEHFEALRKGVEDVEKRSEEGE